jgi:hypothetical protein
MKTTQFIKSIIKEELSVLINENDRKEELLKQLEVYTDEKQNRNYRGISPTLTRLDYELINRDLKSFVKYMDKKMIENLFNYSSDKQNTANEIVRLLKGGRIYHESVVEVIMQNSPNPDEIGLRILGQDFYRMSKGVMGFDYIPSDVLKSVLENTKDTDKVIDIVIKMCKNLFGKKMDADFANVLIKYSKNKDITISELIDVKGNNLDYEDIRYFLRATSEENKYAMVNKIIDINGKKKLGYNMLNLLFSYFDDFEERDKKIEVAQKLINMKGPSLDKDEIESILEILYREKEVIKKLLVKAGVDKSDIPS